MKASKINYFFNSQFFTEKTVTNNLVKFVIFVPLGLMAQFSQNEENIYVKRSQTRIFGYIIIYEPYNQPMSAISQHITDLSHNIFYKYLISLAHSRYLKDINEIMFLQNYL